MPTYQYSCTDCGHFFEQFQSFSDDSLTECPACSGRLRKVFNAVGVVFKGSGFYRTDSRSSSTPAEKAGSTATDASPKPAATGTEGGSGSSNGAAKSTSSTSGNSSSAASTSTSAGAS